MVGPAETPVELHSVFFPPDRAVHDGCLSWPALGGLVNLPRMPPDRYPFPACAKLASCPSRKPGWALRVCSWQVHDGCDSFIVLQKFLYCFFIPVCFQELMLMDFNSLALPFSSPSPLSLLKDRWHCLFPDFSLLELLNVTTNSSETSSDRSLSGLGWFLLHFFPFSVLYIKADAERL